MDIDNIAIPLLSTETKQAQWQTFAYCVNCKRIYQDDLPVAGLLMCPHCDKYALYRGLTKEEIKQRNLEIRPSDKAPAADDASKDPAGDPRQQHRRDRRRTKPL